MAKSLPLAFADEHREMRRESESDDEPVVNIRKSPTLHIQFCSKDGMARNTLGNR